MAEKQTSKRKPRRFFVGYHPDHSGSGVIYGRRFYLETYEDDYSVDDYCEPMSATEARKAQQGMPCDGAVVFELVPVTLDGDYDGG